VKTEICKALHTFKLDQHYETIYDNPNDLIDAGFPAAFLLPLIIVFQSAEGYRYCCRAKNVDEMIGISHHSLVCAIAESLGVPSGTGSGFTGRGFAMRAKLEAIQEILREQQESNSSEA
jgi:hypothetical protein